MTVQAEFDSLEKDMLALKSDMANYNVATLREKLAEVKRVADDERGTAEERLAWLREFLV